MSRMILAGCLVLSLGAGDARATITLAQAPKTTQQIKQDVELLRAQLGLEGDSHEVQYCAASPAGVQCGPGSTGKELREAGFTVAVSEQGDYRLTSSEGKIEEGRAGVEGVIEGLRQAKGAAAVQKAQKISRTLTERPLAALTGDVDAVAWTQPYAITDAFQYGVSGEGVMLASKGSRGGGFIGGGSRAPSAYPASGNSSRSSGLGNFSGSHHRSLGSGIGGGPRGGSGTSFGGLPPGRAVRPTVTDIPAGRPSWNQPPTVTPRRTPLVVTPETTRPSVPAPRIAQPLGTSARIPSYGIGGGPAQPNRGSVTQGPRGVLTSTNRHPDGRWTQRTITPSADGAKRIETSRFNPRTGRTSRTVESVAQDGSRMTWHANGARTEFRPRDGVRTRWSPNGMQTTTNRIQRGNRIEVTKVITVNNHSTTVINHYDHHYCRGGYYPAYVPIWDPYYYSPVYYSPWRRPVTYAWGYGYYSPYYYSYFRPYTVYSTPLDWLTDFVILDAIASNNANVAANQQAQQQQIQQQQQQIQQQQQAQQQGQQAAINDEIKKQVALQVQEALADYKAQKPVTLDNALNTRHIFAVHEEISAMDVDSQEACTLSPGDLIRLSEVPAEGVESAAMSVVAAKAGEGSCSAGSHVTISLATLQEMQNEFVQRLEKGMQQMKKEKESGKLQIEN